MNFSTISRGLVVAAFAGIAAPLSAQTTFDFANPDFNPINGAACTGSDRCGALAGPLNFSKGGINVGAYGFYNGTSVVAVQDIENRYDGTDMGDGTRGAGLGVYHENLSGGFVNSDDNITSGETLKLTFGEAIQMNWIGLRSEGHNFTSWTPNATFEYSTNGSDWVNELLPNGTGSFTFSAPLISKDFYFRFAQEDGKVFDQFYLSAANVTEGDFQVPEPASIALLGLGLFSLGVVSRRKTARRIS